MRQRSVDAGDVGGVRKADFNNSAALQLTSSTCLNDPIYQHITLGDDGTGLGPRLGVAGELQELAQPDHVSADLDALRFTAHLTSIGSNS